MARSAELIAQTAAWLAFRKREPGEGPRHSVVAQDTAELHKLAGMLHRIAEQDCNEQPSARREARELRLRKLASAIAWNYGLRCYFQTDPRGCPLYLIPEDLQHEQDDPTNYNTQGFAVPRLGR